jgi:hypothetical protein
MTRLQETHRRINAEIAQEKAVALGRAGERLEAALARAAAVGHAVGLRHHRIVDQQFPEPPRRAASRRPPRT